MPSIWCNSYFRWPICKPGCVSQMKYSIRFQYQQAWWRNSYKNLMMFLAIPASCNTRGQEKYTTHWGLLPVELSQQDSLGGFTRKYSKPRIRIENYCMKHLSLKNVHNIEKCFYPQTSVEKSGRNLLLWTSFQAILTYHQRCSVVFSWE